MRHYPGETGRRQPVHTVYGGAHLFKADSAKRLGSLAQRSMPPKRLTAVVNFVQNEQQNSERDDS